MQGRLVLTALTILCITHSFGQYQFGTLPEFFFGRMPSARAEAMAKSYAAIDGDLGSIHFNPAGIATCNQIEINTSFTPPGYYSTKGYYTFYGVSYKPNKYLQIALSRFQFNYGKTQVINATKTPYSEKNTITIAAEPIKNILVGLNANYFVWQPGIDRTSSCLFLDVGVLKKIPIYSSRKQQQQINVGVSVSNVNFSKFYATFNTIEQTYHLPVIARYGISYITHFGKKSGADSTSLFKITALSEYQMLLNSAYGSAVKFGGEIMIFNLLSLRSGWYSEKVYDYGLPYDNKSNISALTYGLGLHLPSYLLFKLPMSLHFDFTTLPQVSSSKNDLKFNNFQTYSFRLIYVPNK